jgi:hypothetical protein
MSGGRGSGLQLSTPPLMVDPHETVCMRGAGFDIARAREWSW